MNRNPAIELYRCVLMLGICVLHAAITPGVSRAWLINLLCFCVDGFVFITGYYGCKFKLSKVMRLLGVDAICAFICAKGDVRHAINVYCGYWFLHAYVLMMVFAPLVDAILEKSINLKVVLPLLFVIFVWGHAPTLPVVGEFVPKTAGLTNYSGLTLLGVYIIGRLYKKMGLDERLRVVWVAFAAVVFMVLCALDLNEYNSPTSALLAGCGFFLFSRIKINSIISKVVFIIAPSIFAVYLLHQPGCLFSQDSFVRDCVVKGWNVYWTYFVCGLIVFTGCLVVDIPRRLLGKYLVKIRWKWLDEFHDKCCDKLQVFLCR